MNNGRPCAVAGTFGRGSWLLSYSHLETPADFPGSEQAGAWLLHILRSWCDSSLTMTALPALSFDALPVLWEDAVLLSAKTTLQKLIALAGELGLLFPRNRWLLGWRSGVPGAQFNSLNAALSTTLSLPPDTCRIHIWKEKRNDFEKAFALFAQGARSWLLARRLADTLADSAPGMLPRELLVRRRTQRTASGHAGRPGMLFLLPGSISSRLRPQRGNTTFPQGTPGIKKPFPEKGKAKKQRPEAEHGFSVSRFSG